MKILAKAGDDTIDLRSLSNQDLYRLAKEAKDLQDAVWEELDRWDVIRCEVCGADDLSYRSEPFYGWSQPSGHLLCPACTIRFGNDLPNELSVSVVDEIMALLD